MFVITGGGSGIGSALAKNLATRGHRVLIIGRRKDKLEETSRHSPLISMLCADVSLPNDQKNIVTALKNQSITGLIHNAGTISPIEKLAKITPESWHKMIETNLSAPLFLSQQLLGNLQGGRVLNISSGAAHFPVAGWGGYCVSKAGLSMLTQCWQVETKTVAFASVMPGIVDTFMQELIRHASNMDQSRVAFYIGLKEEKRLITLDTVASFLSWLLLDINSTEFSSKEWDIYDTSHHQHWLKAPHTVPPLE